MKLEYLLKNYQLHNGFLLAKSLPKIGIDKKSGIYLPVEKDEEAQTSECEVVLVPEGSKFKIGQHIFFSKLVPDNVVLYDDNTSVDSEIELWFVREDDIKLSTT